MSGNSNVESATKLGATPSSDCSALVSKWLATGPKSLKIDAALEVLAGVVTAAGSIDIDGAGWDTGLTSMNNPTASRVITNGAPLGDQNTTPPAQSENYRIRNIKVDGNRRNNGKTDVSGNWIFAIDLANVARVILENLWVYDSPTYAVRLNNCADVVARGCRFEAPSNAGNTDGLHFDGPASDIRISDCYFQTGDDAIALNMPEGYGGAILRAAITNCVFNNCLSALRIYSYNSALPNSYVAGRIVFANCSGQIVPDTSNFLQAVFILGFQVNAAHVEAVRDFLASNCTFQSSGKIASAMDNCGAVAFDNFIWDAPTNPNPWVLLNDNGNQNVSISSLTFRGCRIRRTTLGSAAAFAVASAGGGASIGRLEIDGFSVENEAGQSYAAIPYLIDTTNLSIGELYIASLDPANIAALVNPANGFAGISKITGPGLAACGFPVPDSLVPNGVPYISANGAPGHLCAKDPSGNGVQLA